MSPLTTVLYIMPNTFCLNYLTKESVFLSVHLVVCLLARTLINKTQFLPSVGQRPHSSLCWHWLLKGFIWHKFYDQLHYTNICMTWVWDTCHKYQTVTRAALGLWLSWPQLMHISRVKLDYPTYPKLSGDFILECQTIPVSFLSFQSLQKQLLPILNHSRPSHFKEVNSTKMNKT